MTDLTAANQRIAELEEKLREVQRQVDFLARQLFGKKSEQTPAPPDAAQMDLALEMENAAIENAPPAKAEKKKGGSRKGRKMRAALLPADLPVEETVINPPEVEAAPDQWRRIGAQSVERLERIPGRLFIQRIGPPGLEWSSRMPRPSPHRHRRR